MDPETTYIYLTKLMGDRTKESWHLVMESLKDLGLNLKVNISDAGNGLLAGIKEAFPDSDQQTVVSHTSRDLGAEVNRFVDKTYSELEDLYRCEDVLAHPFHKWKKTVADAEQRIESLRISVSARIEDTDALEILKGWVQEMVDFSGYTYDETTDLINWLLDEMAAIAVKYGEKSKLMKEIDRYRVRVPSVLTFLNRLFDELREAAKELGVPEIVFQLAYRRLTALKSPEIYQELTEQIRRIAGGENLHKIDEVLERILKSIKRASSLVENVNSRLRMYMNIKKNLSDSFYSLLQLYFNTKKYRRSRVEERVNHSPVELLTHEEWPELVDLFEECGFWRKEEKTVA